MQYCECARKTSGEQPAYQSSQQNQEGGLFNGDLEARRSVKQTFSTDFGPTKSDDFGAANLAAHVNPRGVG